MLVWNSWAGILTIFSFHTKTQKEIISHMKTTLLLNLLASLLLLHTYGKKPNILFIFTDDHAYQAVGAYDSWLKEHCPTPNIDSLARDGMLFEQCYVTNSICGPMRAAIQTGKYSHERFPC